MKTLTSKLSSVLSTLSAAAMLAIGTSGCLISGSAGIDVGVDIDPIYVEPAAFIEQVVVDTGASMAVDPGAGIGVFVQYDQGGHWTIFTTCDTDYSATSCDFDMLVYPTDARTLLDNVEGFDLDASDSFTLGNDGSINLVTQTAFGMNGMMFDADPGAEIEIDILIDGVAQPEFVYTVSYGRLVDGVSTNPVDFLPATF